MRKEEDIPQELFWDTDVTCLDPQENKQYIIMKMFFGYFERKYGPDGFNRHHVLKSLIYFEDADKEPEPEMLVDFSWTVTKRFFVESVRTFGVP